MAAVVMAGLAPPVMVGDLPIDGPLPDLNSDGRHQAARLLCRLHGRPLGEVTVPLELRPVTAAELAARVWPLIRDQVGKHCAEDGIDPPGQLTAAGLAWPGRPRCGPRLLAEGGPAITVVVATRDRTDSLLRCLASLSRLEYRPFDVVVVDSAPRSDATARMLAGGAEWPFPLRYMRTARPGLGLAHNEALPAIIGEIAAFTDDDVVVDSGWLAALAAAFTESGAACVTGPILPAELETQAQLLVEEAGGYARGFDRRTYRAGMPDPGPLFPFTAGRFGSGANMAFRTDWLMAHGGFDPATGAGTPARGGDDLTAFLTVITSGGTLVYEPAAILRHWHRRDYEGMRRQSFGYGVGLGAFLAASVCAWPALLLAMLRRVGPAIQHMLSSGSVKNVGRSGQFPRELVWRERAGLLVGPFAYAVSRWRYRDCTRRAGGRRPGRKASQHYDQ